MPYSSHRPEIQDNGRVSDAVGHHWVDTHVPTIIRPYLRLSRIDRPIGTWLLLLPCWWSLALCIVNNPSSRRLEDIWIVCACAIGAVLMRGAGCSWNDYNDRKLDAQVKRTRSRPLPSGQITPKAALIWMIMQSILALIILLTFNSFAIFIGVASLIPVAIYPFAKRFTWWPQIFLGIAFNWGALLAWAAHSGALSLIPTMLYISGIFWTLFYDTIYAHQDREDDDLVGIRSTARLLGEHTKIWLATFATLAFLFMAFSAFQAISASTGFWVIILLSLGVAIFGLHLAWQLKQLNINNSEVCLNLFRSNRNAGLLPVFFFAVAAWFA